MAVMSGGPPTMLRGVLVIRWAFPVMCRRTLTVLSGMPFVVGGVAFRMVLVSHADLHGKGRCPQIGHGRTDAIKAGGQLTIAGKLSQQLPVPIWRSILKQAGIDPKER